jgi:hypothetical protein
MLIHNKKKGIELAAKGWRKVSKEVIFDLVTTNIGSNDKTDLFILKLKKIIKDLILINKISQGYCRAKANGFEYATKGYCIYIFYTYYVSQCFSSIIYNNK